MRQYLEEAHDRHLFGSIPWLAPGRDHARACHAEELGVRRRGAQRFDQARTERIARGLGCHERNAQCSAPGHVRVDAARLPPWLAQP